MQNDPAVLADDSSLITIFLSGFILYHTLAVHARHVTCLNHLLDRVLVGYPVRIEHARNTRHRQDICICLQQAVFEQIAHRVVLSTKLTVVACERVVVVNEGHRILALACTRQTCALALGVVESTYAVVQCIVLGAEIKHHRVPVRFIQSCL